MHVGHHTSDVSCGVGALLVTVLIRFGELDRVQVRRCRRVEVASVALIEGIDLSPVGHRDGRVGKDEFTQGLSRQYRFRDYLRKLTSSKVKP